VAGDGRDDADDRRGVTRPGRYVILEGGEGVGKTTQVTRLRDRLEGAGREVLTLREPGGDPFGEAGRALLLGELDRRPQTEVLMFNALRAQLLVDQIRPALDRGIWVLSDRGRLSTIAYQGYGGGAELEWTRSVCDLVTELCPPDLEIVLALDADTARRRRDLRGTTDRFEQLDEAFHDRVTTGYLAEAERRGLPVVDAAGSPEEVEAVLWAVLRDHASTGPALASGS
jgi:dTMP kinase